MPTAEMDEGRRTESCGNVFLDLGFPPDEAILLSMRSDLMCRLGLWLRDSGLTPPQAAEQLGVSQTRIAELMRGKWDRFSLDTLIQLAVRAGQRVELKVAA